MCERERECIEVCVCVCVFDTTGHVTALISRDAASADRGSLFTRKFRIPHYFIILMLKNNIQKVTQPST